MNGEIAGAAEPERLINFLNNYKDIF